MNYQLLAKMGIINLQLPNQLVSYVQLVNNAQIKQLTQSFVQAPQQNNTLQVK